MTPADLEQLVAQADLNALAKACESLTETERRKLSTTASSLAKEIAGVRWSQGQGKPLERLMRWIKGISAPDIHDQARASELAVLACCPLSQAKRVRGGIGIAQDIDHALAKVLSDRKPDWIDVWITEKLKGEWKQIEWVTLRTLMKTGVCRKPDDDGYLELMAMAMPGHWLPTKDRPAIPLSRKLLAEKDLLEEEIWRLFEIETVAFKHEFYEQRSSHDYETWPTALKRLADEGHLDRRRLLDASLAGLSTGLKSNALSGYFKFHDSLEPTPDEKVERQQVYLDLLASQTPPVVSFALKTLKDIAGADRLDAPVFVRSVGAVLSGRLKSQPKAALVMLKKLANKSPELRAEIAVAAGEGLTHVSSDIQERSLKLLVSLGDDISENQKPGIIERLADISASCRALADELIGKLDINVAEQPQTLEPSDSGAQRSELFARAESLEPCWRRSAGVDDAIEAIRDGLFPPPLRLAWGEVPILSGVEPIQPISTVEELIEAVAHAVEVVDSPDELERILDGISRLCDQKPADFERDTGPLFKRVMDRRAGDESRGLLTSIGAPENFWLLLRAWLRGNPSPPPKSEWAARTGPRKIWNSRLAELAGRVVRQTAAPLLAAPTHAQGWIDPREFIRRVLELQSARLDPPKLDLIQALLRLAPDHRAEALSEARSIRHDVGRAIQWALGGDEGPTRKHKPAATIWLAAGRCRAPRKPLPVLKPLGLDLGDADGVEPAAYQWRSFKSSFKAQGTIYYNADIEISINPSGGKGCDEDDQPTAALHRQHDKWSAYGISAGWLRQWLGMIWPANPDPMLATAIDELIQRIDETSSSIDPNYAYLHVLFAKNLELSEIAGLTLWVGLIGRDADARGLAVDALIEAIQDGRVHPTPFGDVFAKLASGGWLKLNRVKDALGEVARISSLHAYVVAEILERWLASLERLPRDGHHALELLLELKTQLALRVEANARTVLERIKGSNKSAKAARALLAIEESESSPPFQDALLAQLRARVERAERWAASAVECVPQ